MGMVIDGQWVQEDRIYENGGFERRASLFDVPLGKDLARSIREEPGRYHLIASQSCPWSHRTILLRSFKGLEGVLPMQIAHGPRIEGYAVNGGAPWRVPGSDQEIIHMHELYRLADPGYTGRSTVPVLWDSVGQRIVSNESARIMRLLDSVSGEPGGLDFTLLPPGLTPEIDAFNDRLQTEFSNAVYRAGLARRQDHYEAAVEEVFSILAELEQRLAARRYLFGAVLTEADLRLLPALLRFDHVYHSYFRCSRKCLADYSNLWAYTRDLYGWRGVAEMTNFRAIREGYFLNDGDGNPFGVIPVAPEIDWFEPHGRDVQWPAQLTLRNGDLVTVDPVTLQPIGEA
ncbi:glutathione S-transferase family protein [Denitrobaculum tricleocarpae]|uniref:Glutathione-dependent reductase n=1 Tax=Denitrobaculum tricleocarpae TaxID=2591009 RepID=A0A545T264_9PROT|nr:glutathione S-transferase C-terminal domain-containing protein [Denitrobaculum tricleocarpae]TQV71299.1 glutathione-dependent reductase [Denitrobaculum tricleocarpae]